MGLPNVDYQTFDVASHELASPTVPGGGAREPARDPLAAANGPMRLTGVSGEKPAVDHGPLLEALAASLRAPRVVGRLTLRDGVVACVVAALEVLWPWRVWVVIVGSGGDLVYTARASAWLRGRSWRVSPLVEEVWSRPRSGRPGVWSRRWRVR